jgi:two-component sensor histidine kinase
MITEPVPMQTDLSDLYANDAELLLEEFAHRVNNELAVAIASVSRAGSEARGAPVAATLQRLHGRLVNLARLNRTLQAPLGVTVLDAGAYLDELCRSIRATLLDSINLRFAGARYSLPSGRCWRLGMIVSELVENARRHAFDAGRGTISVELRGNDAAAVCKVADDGRGYVEGKLGRGLRIVHALAETTRGTIARTSGPGGTTWIVTIPRKSKPPVHA